jgi:HSP90 family molecular chaperone
MSKEGLNFDNEDREERKKEEEELNSEHKVVKEYLKVVLAGKVQHIKMIFLLSYNSADLMQSAYWTSPMMQQYMKAQNVALGGSNTSTMGSFNHVVLEVNLIQPIVWDLERMVDGILGDKESNARNFAILLTMLRLP